MFLPRIRTAPLALFSALVAVSSGFADGQSQWVYPEAGGKLAYRALPGGDRIMDFSYAGYRGGGVSIPDVPVKATIQPGGDDPANIQKALDQVSQLPLVNGHRGAVLLAAGTYHCDKPLNIGADGVVLRGESGAILELTGQPHIGIIATGRQGVTEEGKSTAITDDYVPSGSDTFSVASVAGLQPGDTIRIIRPVTDAWVAFMGMNNLVRTGVSEHWVSGALQAERTIRAISGNRLTVTPPLSDNYDAGYLNPPGSTVVKTRVSGTISQIGVEGLRIECPPQPVEITVPLYQAVKFEGVVDSWMQNLETHDTVNTLGVDGKSSRITIRKVRMMHTVATKGAAKPFDIAVTGAQVLVDQCSGKGDGLFYYATMGRTQGPNVILNCNFEGAGSIQPHMRWSTGLLIDGCQVPAGSIDLMNRGIMGSGHGWAIGWSVAWNCQAKTFLIQQPPGSTNWAIGCKGAQTSRSMPGGDSKAPLPNGIFDSPERPVAPASLYLAQLRERLGNQAVKNIGY
jgi:hypothetical protein